MFSFSLKIKVCWEFAGGLTAKGSSVVTAVAQVTAAMVQVPFTGAGTSVCCRCGQYMRLLTFSTL